MGKPSPLVKRAVTLELPRGPSTKEFLSLRWDYPVYVQLAHATDSTEAKPARSALPVGEAFRFLAAGDPRPLLVLRECARCNKTDRALLSPGSDNERTLLLSRWFHCVKLPVDVDELDHPFHALFASPEDGHLFVSQADGSGRFALAADTSRTELWASMTKVLSVSYACDISKVSRDIVRHFDRLDVLDTRLRDLQKRRDALMQTPLVDPLDVQKVRTRLAEVEREIAVEKDEIERLALIERRAEIESEPALAKPH